MIEVKDLKYNKKGIDILSDINFLIGDNSTTCFIGGKNSGKSTLMKILSGSIKSFSGEVLVDGIDLSENRTKKIDIVHEKREMGSELNTYEYLRFYALLYGWKEDEALSIFIDSMLRDFSIMSYKYTNIDNLDAETFKIVDIIRVMINDPDVIIFDNLFFSDNFEFNNKLYEFVLSLINEKTIIFSSRNMDYIEDIVDNIGIVDAGYLVTFGKKDDVYKKAELNTKIQVEIVSDISKAINVLNNDERVANVIYEANRLTFSIVNNHSDGDSVKNIEIENSILKTLIDNDVKVYSYRKEQVKFEHLLHNLKG